MRDIVPLSVVASRTTGINAVKGIQEFLIFTLAGDPYAVELARVREIVSPPTLTEVPRSAADVMGVCSVRGLLVTVIDLRRRLKVAERPQTRFSRILLAHADSGEVIGLFVDEVRHVVRLNGNDVELAHAVLGGDVSDHVLGIGRVLGEVIVVLNMGSVTG
jgi:purine-binding chemotaxis protein CheW